MGRYAIVGLATGLVVNTALWDRESDWAPGAGLIAVESETASIGWMYANGVFSPPAVESPTPEEVLASQGEKLRSLNAEASAQKAALSSRIDVLNDAVLLEMATEVEIAEKPVREAQLVEWKRYAVLLGRITGQDGWPLDVDWPAKPAEGMDLSTSASATETA